MNLVDRLKSALGFAERRKHPRVASSAVTLKFGGEKYKSVDWSLGGCRIRTGSGQLQIKQRITGRIWFAGADGRGEFVAEIVRVDSDGHVALRWLEMSPHIFVAMHGLGQ